MSGSHFGSSPRMGGERPLPKKLMLRLVLFLTALGLLALGMRQYVLLGHELSAPQMRQWILSWGALAPLASLALMIFQ